MQFVLFFSTRLQQLTHCTAEKAHLKDRLSIFVCQLHFLGNAQPCFFTTGDLQKNPSKKKHKQKKILITTSVLCHGEERKELDLLCQTEARGMNVILLQMERDPAQQLSHTPGEGTTHQLGQREGVRPWQSLLTQAGPCLAFRTLHSKSVFPRTAGKMKTATDRKVSSKKQTPRLQSGHMLYVINPSYSIFPWNLDFQTFSVLSLCAKTINWVTETLILMGLWC